MTTYLQDFYPNAPSSGLDITKEIVAGKEVVHIHGEPGMDDVFITKNTSRDDIKFHAKRISELGFYNYVAILRELNCHMYYLWECDNEEESY